MNISRRIMSLLPIILLGMTSAFLLPNNLRAWNPVYDLDIRSLFLVSMMVVAYVLGFKTIKNLIKQSDYQLLRHLDVLMIIASIFFGYIIGVFPYHYFPELRNHESGIWAVLALMTLFTFGKLYFLFRKQKTDAVLLSVC